MWRAALIWTAVPSVLAGARPGACGLVQSVGPAAVVAKACHDVLDGGVLHLDVLG
jgi:hypothetical protein